MKLVIVESPSKAKTIVKYLGQGYRVIASGGHVSDLPQKSLGIDVNNNYKPEYVVTPSKEETIRRIKSELAKCDKVYLATDPDREGEAISWHLANVCGIKDKNVRIVFNEISKKAVNAAIENPHSINMNLVNAQQARRVLDRLVGYELSPVISRKVKGAMSAGRVQSVALKMIVEREREIRNFKPEEYWNIYAFLLQEGKSAVFKAEFVDVDGKKYKVKNKDAAEKIVKASKEGEWSVDKVKRVNSQSKPQPPFTTSTMQQDASGKLSLTAPQVMQLAQQLYEGVELGSEGQVALVTYIRTDSGNGVEIMPAEKSPDEIGISDISRPVIFRDVSLTGDTGNGCWCETVDGEYVTTRRHIVDGNGATFAIQTRGSCLYAGEEMPTGKFSVSGIIDYSGGEYFMVTANHGIAE